MALKWPWKTLKKLLLKITKTLDCPFSLAISKALTIHPTNFLRPLFNSKFFLSFNFYFNHKTARGHENGRPKMLVSVFLIEYSCLNCLKVDRIQDYKKKK